MIDTSMERLFNTPNELLLSTSRGKGWILSTTRESIRRFTILQLFVLSNFSSKDSSIKIDECNSIFHAVKRFQNNSAFYAFGD